MASSNAIRPLVERIVGVCSEVHRELGPGLLEAVYVRCLCRALADAGFTLSLGGVVPIRFRGSRIRVGFQYDMLVERQVLLNIKAVECLLPVHRAQLRTWLMHTGYPAGLLVNFSAPLLTRNSVIRMLARPGPGR